jgi:hypothetical protein
MASNNAAAFMQDIPHNFDSEIEDYYLTNVHDK